MKRAAVVGAVVVAVVVTVAAGAAGTNRHALGEAMTRAPFFAPTSAAPTAGTDTAAGALTGVLDPAAPAVHAFKLTAGEAVRMWAVPTSGEMDMISDYDEPFADGMSVGVAVDPTVNPELWESIGWTPSEPEDWFFSDYTESPSGGSFDPSEYGLVVVYTSGGASADFNYQLDPPFFSCADRGLTQHDDQGAWLAFIAPITGTYKVLVVGIGGYELHVESRPAPPEIAADSAGTYPYAGGAFEALINAHWSFLFEEPFYPTDELFSDGNYYESEERCRGLENDN